MHSLISCPEEYFRNFYSSNLFHYFRSNEFISQTDEYKSWLNLTDLEEIIGSLLVISIVKISRFRLYWSSNLECRIKKIPLYAFQKCHSMKKLHLKKLKNNSVEIEVQFVFLITICYFFVLNRNYLTHFTFAYYIHNII